VQHWRFPGVSTTPRSPFKQGFPRYRSWVYPHKLQRTFNRQPMASFVIVIATTYI